MSDTFQYDVFVSYSSQDKPAALELAERLKANGLLVWLDEWRMLGSNSLTDTIERGMKESRTIILLISQNYVGKAPSEWVTRERRMAMSAVRINTSQRLLPVRLDDVEIPLSLDDYLHVDFRSRDEQTWTRLVAACRSNPTPSSASLPVTRNSGAGTSHAASGPEPQIEISCLPFGFLGGLLGGLVVGVLYLLEATGPDGTRIDVGGARVGACMCVGAFGGLFLALCCQVPVLLSKQAKNDARFAELTGIIGTTLGGSLLGLVCMSAFAHYGNQGDPPVSPRAMGIGFFVGGYAYVVGTLWREWQGNWRKAVIAFTLPAAMAVPCWAILSLLAEPVNEFWNSMDAGQNIVGLAGGAGLGLYVGLQVAVAAWSFRLPWAGATSSPDQ